MTDYPLPVDDIHALHVGFVVGLAARHGLDVEPIVDGDGNYTASFRLRLPDDFPANVTVVLTVEP